MVHYPQKRAPLAGVAVTVAWIVLSAYYSSIRVDALLCVILAWCGVLYACYLGNTVPKYPLFVGSGRTKVATQGYELLIKGKGQGDDYFTSQRELSFADLDNFQYARGSKVSLKNLLKHYPFTVEPYCLDDENQCVIFVETPMAFDCAMVGPFYFDTQRKVARRLFSIPYAEYNAVCAELQEADFSKLILLYNTSRCGSTLVSKAFDSMANIQSISEPDMFTSMTHIAMECKEEAGKMAQLQELATSTARLLLVLRTRRYPDRPILALKFRFQVINIAHMLKQAIPGASTMYLYRNCIDVADSMASAFIDNFVLNFLRWLRLDIFYVFTFSDLWLHMPILMPLWGSELYPYESFREMGGVAPFLMSWISGMAKAREALLKGDIQLAFRYEDIVDDRSDLLMKVLRTAGFKPSLSHLEMEQTFATNSQEDSAASSRRRSGDGVLSEKFHYLRRNDLGKIRKILARHPVINDHNYILPKTVFMHDEARS